MTREELVAAADGALSREEILRRLGWSSGPARRKLLDLAAEFGISLPGPHPVDTVRRRVVPFYDEALVRDAVDSSANPTEALRRLGYQRPVHQYKQLHDALSRFGIEPPWNQAPVAAPAAVTPRRVPTPRRSAFADGDAVRRAVSGASNASAALVALGVRPGGGNYDALERACERLDIAPPPRRRRPPKSGKPRASRPLKAPFDDPEVVKRACHGSDQRIQVLRCLGLPATTTAYSRLETACQRYGIELPGKGRRISGAPAPELDDDQRNELIARLFVQGTTFVVTNTLRTNLARLGILPERCATCSRPAVWAGAPLVLHLDHENGDCCDNRLENLRYVCPNCHAQTPTFGGRNRVTSGRRRKARTPPAVVLDEHARAQIIEKYFYRGVPRSVPTATLKVQLAKLGMLPSCCAACDLLPEWEGAPLVLQLDHRNGERTDNRLSNLRYLCPNCHSQTPTYAGRNRGASSRGGAPAPVADRVVA